MVLTNKNNINKPKESDIITSANSYKDCASNNIANFISPTSIITTDSHAKHITISEESNTNKNDINNKTIPKIENEFDRSIATETPYYYQVATPRSPHEFTFLDKLSNNEEQETFDAEQHAKFLIAKREIMNNIHLYMLLRYKDCHRLEQDILHCNQEINLLKKLYSVDINDLITSSQRRTCTNINTNTNKKPNSTTFHKAAAKKATKCIHKPKKDHKKKQTTTIMNSGVIGKTSDGVTVFKRVDGILIILKCETCGKEGFTSAQGIVNHCRLKHSKLYSSQPLAILNNQKILPIQSMKILDKFNELNLDPQKNFLPFVAVTLLPLNATDSSEVLDSKLELVNKEDSNNSGTCVISADTSNASTISTTGSDEVPNIDTTNRGAKGILLGHLKEKFPDSTSLIKDTVEYIKDYENDAKNTIELEKTAANVTTDINVGSGKFEHRKSDGESVTIDPDTKNTGHISDSSNNERKDRYGDSALHNLRKRRRCLHYNLRSNIPYRSKRWDDYELS
ncbi:uncharacterized protein SCODWIG_02521 [Saccharomycodes ludwigii]|uniref:Protein AHC1 n=1 Tax=Saccharomycodes ludwigii TaxID=36035 RepID=A0A376B9F9_9ASCO|nr:hypothetical protein SCDLUD_004897 [Saccharomycodes ludwigii]KAH3899454.1 hypothetical protein SCDLUD_004897 [Saccharomycodes ludwigii]SSD60760.1 uncharacterized protein SCODWIG_02521 [Saccharomycodes ludwigii]